MVASDTLVGIVGAVILTIALIGVFVYEANAPGGGEEFDSSQHAVEADGSQSYQEGDPGTPPVIDPTPGVYTLECSVEGLPELGGELYYGAFLKKPSETVSAGTLSKSGRTYNCDYTSTEDHTDATQLLITLETSQNPNRPGVPLFNATFENNDQLTFSGNITLALSEQQSLAVSQGGGTITVSGTLSNLPVRDGFMYRIWAHDDAEGGAVWRVVANISMPESGSTFSTEVDGTASGAVEGGFDRLVISLEKEGSTQTEMSGFPVYERGLS